jgi:multiple sugar transport system permease protein
MKNRITLSTVIVHGLLIAVCAMMVMPFLVVLTTSLKCPTLGDDLTPTKLDIVPQRWYWGNYLTAWRAGKLGTAYWNSLSVAVVWTVGTVLMAAMAAYAMGRRQCFGQRWLLLFFLASLMFAGQTTIVPRFILFRSLGLYDSLAIFMIPCAGAGSGAFFIYLLYHWFQNVPRELDEAATLDGCSEWDIFFRIVMPLSLPALVTVSIFAFLASWNSFAEPYVMLESEANMTMPLAMQMFPQGSLSLQAAKAAAVIISVIPALVVFILLQRWFLRGLSIGALKG